MFSFLFSLLPTLVVLGVLISIHELGHFLACRFSKVKVEKFSIGFGPEILTWVGKETKYSISLIPFGGFVKPKGESLEEVKAQGGSVTKGDYLAASKAHRLLILTAGVFMNFVLAYILFVWVMIVGRPVPSAEIGGLMPGLPAQQSGLKVGDVVTDLNGTPVSSWQDLTVKIMRSAGEPLVFKIQRGGEEVQIAITPQIETGRDLLGHATKVPRIGILRGEKYHTERYSPAQAIIEAARLEWNLIELTFESLWRLVCGQLSPKTLVGPLGIVSMAGSAAQMGWTTLLQFTALLSVSLGVINLLPVPALDGGHIFFLLIEILFRRPLNPRIQERMTQVGFGFLIMLMVFVVFNDLMNMGAIEKIKSLFP